MLVLTENSAPYYKGTPRRSRREGVVGGGGGGAEGMSGGGARCVRRPFGYLGPHSSCQLREAQTVKNLPVMQETWVRSLGREDPLEKGMAIHSSIFA